MTEVTCTERVKLIKNCIVYDSEKIHDCKKSLITIVLQHWNNILLSCHICTHLRFTKILNCAQQYFPILNSTYAVCIIY